MARHQLVPLDEYDEFDEDEEDDDLTTDPVPLEPVIPARRVQAEEGVGTMFIPDSSASLTPAFEAAPMLPALESTRMTPAVEASPLQPAVEASPMLPPVEHGQTIPAAEATATSLVRDAVALTPGAEATAPTQATGTGTRPAIAEAEPHPSAGDETNDPEPIGPPYVIPAERRSTPEERQILRLSLAWRYDTEAREVVVLLAERPGIRTAAAGEADAMVTDLVALRAFLAGDHRTLVTNQRAGRIGTDGPLLSCVTGALRRVPSYRGVAFANAPGEAALARERYRPGRVLWEPAPLVTHARQAPAGADDVEFVLWSATGRRCEDFAPDRETRPILFSPSTRFGVLATETTADGGFRVYLTEVRQRDLDRWDGDTVAADARILERLRETAGKSTPGAPAAVVPLIGVGPDSQPFVPPPA